MRVLRFLQGLFRRLRAVYWGPNVDSIRRLERAGRFSVGPHTYGRPMVHAYMLSQNSLRIGAYCSIADGVTVMLGGEHAADRVSTYPFKIAWQLPGAGEDGMPVPTGDTVVGSDVWLAMDVWIRSGVQVGDGAILAAGAVVVKDVPPFAVVGGNPAKVIRYRHTEEQREALLAIRWWDWIDSEVLLAADLLAADDTDAFIEYARARIAELGPEKIYRSAASADQNERR